jgi:tetratricopeptide (TPR) repeat protein
VGAGLLALLVLLTWAQTHYWHDTVLLWAHTLEATGPANDFAHLALAEALAKQGELDLARPHYAAALEADPGNAEVQFAVGLFLLKDGNPQQAVRHLEEAVRLDPDGVPKRNNLATTLFQQGRTDEAIAHGQEVLKVDPNSVPALFVLGLAYGRQESELDRAVAYLRKAVELAPGDVNCRCALARNLCRAGRAEEGRQEYREAFRLDPAWAEGYDRTAWALAAHPEAAQRNGPRAVDLAETVCLAAEGRRPQYLQTLAAAYAEVGRWDRAEETNVKALELARSSGPAGLTAALEEQLALARAHQPVRDAGLGGS